MPSISSSWLKIMHFAVRRGPRAIARLTAVLVLMSALTLSSALATEEFGGTVSKVTDGDTFRIREVEPAIRIWGLDAPERDERGGSAATKTLRSLIEGQRLTCVLRDIDRYRRFVGQCFLPDGRDIAQAMILSGAATEYCKYSRGFYGTC